MNTNGVNASLENTITILNERAKVLNGEMDELNALAEQRASEARQLSHEAETRKAQLDTLVKALEQLHKMTEVNKSEHVKMAGENAPQGVSYFNASNSGYAQKNY